MKILLSKKTIEKINPEFLEAITKIEEIKGELSGSDLERVEVSALDKEEIMESFNSIKPFTLTELQEEYCLEINDDFIINYITLYKELAGATLDLIKNSVNFIKFYLIPKVQRFIEKNL